ncbi:hypothetical protein A3K69_02575 [Candidatus Bathyarchaeota archaeon RBG_16_57_9]|jgi:glucose/arabinose dehydrogenase|nr:MAG: hypothetical protein A3K69_02575 [Candidatus Bathyarchaeota archaeon RBG_16_57_9]OGD55831.1 MAG: hypothetical protein A3K81_06415 [Candidatus Bathyarchaeota archaeon RBG_13_60_20]
MPTRRQAAATGAVLIIVLAGLAWWYSQRPVTPEGEPEYTVLANDLEVPWGLALTPEGDILFTERGGEVKLLSGGTVNTIHTVDVHQSGEGGLLGIVLHPSFPDDPRVYIYYTYRDTGGLTWNRVTHLAFSGAQLLNETVVLDHIPAGTFHDGGRIGFGPDGKLYVTTGETGSGPLAQDPASLAGKILRLNPDGSIPEDNPRSGSPVYSMGHRNPQGLAWHPETHELYSTEHGPSGEGLSFAHDEINVIVPGANYGWPEVIGEGDDPGYVNPVLQTGGETWAPSGATFLDDPSSPWHGRLFVACLRGAGIRMVDFPPGDEQAEVVQLYRDLGRIRTIVQGPDGYLYFCTNNRDGRGSPRQGDDIIARFKPP